MRSLVITNSITNRDERSLDKYLAEISRYEVLSPEEEVQLFQRYRNGDERALGIIVNHNLRFVVSVAKQYQNLGLWLGDLINEGNIGLIRAARRFDETKGFKFISYAVWWIRQSILQAINEKSRKIRLPSNHQADLSKILQERSRLLQENEREPSVEELAKAAEMTEGSVQNILRNFKGCKSLDAPIDEDGESSLENVLEDSSIPQPDYQIAEEESRIKQVKDLLDGLPEREALVLAMLFGIGDSRPMTLTDVSERLGLSRERVRQIKQKGILRLRSKMKKVS